MAGRGVRGDRFFAKAAHMDAAVTLLAVEALDAVAAELGVAPFDPLAARRNVVLRAPSSGVLRPGPAMLVTSVTLDASRAGEAAVRRHQLP